MSIRRPRLLLLYMILSGAIQFCLEKRNGPVWIIKMNHINIRRFYVPVWRMWILYANHSAIRGGFSLYKRDTRINHHKQMSLVITPTPGMVARSIFYALFFASVAVVAVLTRYAAWQSRNCSQMASAGLRLLTETMRMNLWRWLLRKQGQGLTKVCVTANAN